MTDRQVLLAILEQVQTLRRVAVLLATLAVPLMVLGIVRLAAG